MMDGRFVDDFGKFAVGITTMQKFLAVHACVEHPRDALEECLSARANNRCIIAFILVMQIFKEAARNHC